MGGNPVIIKSNPYGIVLILDPELPFEELRQAVADKFRLSAGFFKNAKLALTFQGRVLTKEQERILLDEIVQNSKIQILCLVDEKKESEEYYKKQSYRPWKSRIGRGPVLPGNPSVRPGPGDRDQRGHPGGCESGRSGDFQREHCNPGMLHGEYLRGGFRERGMFRRGSYHEAHAGADCR